MTPELYLSGCWAPVDMFYSRALCGVYHQFKLVDPVPSFFSPHPHPHLANGYEHISTHRSFFLRLISHTPPAGDQKGRSQCRVSVTSTSKYSVNQLSSDFCSNISGLFFLLNPLSAVGFLIAQVTTVAQIPYLLLGFTWGLNKKYDGTNA